MLDATDGRHGTLVRLSTEYPRPDPRDAPRLVDHHYESQSPDLLCHPGRRRHYVRHSRGSSGVLRRSRGTGTILRAVGSLLLVVATQAHAQNYRMALGYLELTHPYGLLVSLPLGEGPFNIEGQVGPGGAGGTLGLAWGFGRHDIDEQGIKWFLNAGLGRYFTSANPGTPVGGVFTLMGGLPHRHERREPDPFCPLGRPDLRSRTRHLQRLRPGRGRRAQARHRRPAGRGMAVLTLDAFTTARLLAERLTAAHRDEIHRMHQDPRVMAMLGGVRDETKTREYLERNLAHWDAYGFGLWILRDRASGDVIGRGLLRHLDVEGQDDIETGYAFYRAWWGKGPAGGIERVPRLDVVLSRLVGQGPRRRDRTRTPSRFPSRGPCPTRR